MLKADIPPFQLAKLWTDVATLEERIVELELTEPPSAVIDRVQSRLNVIHSILRPLKHHRANSAAYRHAMQLVYEELRIVTLLLDAWSTDPRSSEHRR
jgi:hypothetical protein